ncbi:hypothetical protein ACQKM1_15700 [Peribacillus frigoritolerans]|uniref:hypothetical protein n=1 Tax=Peribacillus frigoritolerans TaxID=450367 RepID=UPI003D045548
MSRKKAKDRNSTKVKQRNVTSEGNPVNQVVSGDFGYLKDTAVILAIITGLSYFLSLAYQKGEKNFYGINEITSIDLNINSLTNSFYDISSLLGKILMAFVISKIALYFARIIYNKFYKGIENEIISGSLIMVTNILFFGFIICWLPFIILGTGDSISNIMGNYKIFFGIVLSIMLLATVLCFPFQNSIDKILKPIVFLGREKLLQDLWGKFTLSTKLFIFLALINLFSFAFYHYGYTQAEGKEEYVLFEYNDQDYVLLDKDKSQLIVVPLEKSEGKKIIRKENIQTVELKSNQIQFFSFKNIKINKGLIVQPNERKKKLDKMKNILNSIR